MVELGTILSFIQAGGIIVGVAYYIMNIQMARRKLKIDNTILYGNLITNKETVLQWRHVLYEQKYSSFDEWDQKYRKDPEAYSNYNATQGLLGMLGMCLSEGLVDVNLLCRRGLTLLTLAVYPKLKPIIMGYRALYNDPNYGFYSEYLYNEVVRRYPEARMPPERAKVILNIDA